MSKTTALGVTLLVLIAWPCDLTAQQPEAATGPTVQLRENWLLNSSWRMKEGGEAISTCGFAATGWHPTRVPSTVLGALIKGGVYPDVRVGMNSFRIPDASDEFNRKHDLAKYSHLPGQHNPWIDPYWYRTEFALPDAVRGKRVWLNFDGIHYRADVWINGRQVADGRQIVGSFSRYRLDVTEQVRFDQKNCLAVKMHPMDHPGTPDTQLDLFGKDRQYRKEGMKDVGLAMFIGYDCMPTVPDRNMGFWQRVYLDFTGPVDIRHPFVVARLPLPQTSPARLTVSAELVNATAAPQEGILRGTVEEDRRAVREARQAGRRRDPRNRVLRRRACGPGDPAAAALVAAPLRPAEPVSPVASIRDRRTVLGPPAGCLRNPPDHQGNARAGRRPWAAHARQRPEGLLPRRLFQPEVLFDWDTKRIEAEIRYLVEANINIVYFEDIPNPPDEFLDLCDRYGLMFGNCFYGCYWMQPGSQYPLDLDLLARGTVDIIKRYRNHPSLVLYMAMNEGETREDVYTRWRKEILDRDGTRLFIPSGSFPDYRKKVPAWIQPDLPVGMNDYPPKSYGWVEPAQFFRWVRENRNWMFMLESGCPSLPPIDSLRRFLPGVEIARPDASPRYPLDSAWAHHDACHYFRPFDAALRQRFGQPRTSWTTARRETCCRPTSTARCSKRPTIGCGISPAGSPSGS